MNETGIVLFDIQKDGCLNGVYTNEPANGIIYNEIARKRDIEDKREVEGEYDCLWFDVDPVWVHATLTVTEGPARIFTFRWRGEDGNFDGTGYRMNERQIVVHYHPVTIP